MFSKFSLLNSSKSKNSLSLSENTLLIEQENTLSESFTHSIRKAKASSELNESVLSSLKYFEPRNNTAFQQFNDDYNSDQEDQCDDNEIYICFLYKLGKLACSFYDLNKLTLFYLIDIEESLKFELTDLLIQDLQPNYVITSCLSDTNFLNHLKSVCKYNDRGETITHREKPMKLCIIPKNDFVYELSKRQILGINSLENMPKNLHESERIVFFNGLFDFDSKAMIKTVGALLKYLHRNRVNFEFDRTALETPIKFIQPVNLSKLLILDPNSFKSLQIFNDVDLACANKLNYSEASNFRTTLNDRFNNTLYSLYLSQIQTKSGIAKLRSIMLKPTRDTSVLVYRLKLIEFFSNYNNQELIAELRKTLKKCKYINPILKRMRIAKCNLNEWKRLYKTTQAFLKISELARIIHAKLNTGTKLTPMNLSFRSFVSDEHVESRNIFYNLIVNNYEAKLDYLINLFDRVINLKESLEKKRTVVNANVSSRLDEKKLVYAGLSELLTQIAESERVKYDLKACALTYLSLLGFLLVVKVEQMFDLEYFDGSQERIDSARAEFELKNEFKFVFKSTDKFYYKTLKCIELDSELGDLYAEISEMESEILENLQANFITHSHLYANMIDISAELDCLLAFSVIAKENNYTKPILAIEQGSFIEAKQVRHPLVELNFTSSSSYIPNDVQTSNANKIKVITGPNASGKTVYLKQIGLLVYMTFIGSYVPAFEARVGDFNRIFTRLNSNECISLQMSAFSIDLKQISDAVNGSDSRSLILVDEFGKGTDVATGQASVASILKYFIELSPQDLKCPHVYVSTHFYEMLHKRELLFTNGLDRIEFFTFDFLTEESGEEGLEKLVFLYSLKRGITSSSYAFNIAKKANIQEEKIERAKIIFDEIISNLNNNNQNEVKTILSQNPRSIENFLK